MLLFLGTGISDISDRESQDEDADFVGQLVRTPDPSSGDKFLVNFSLQPRVGGAFLNVSCEMFKIQRT